ncbi:MAG: hypothetical protein KGN02_02305 [bacterium]|nr:hypothetical protein [bacterium]
MTSEEHKAAAEKLTAAVKNNTNGAYDEWVASGQALNDPAARAAFVQKHAGLAAAPSAADMQAIHQHVNSSLQADVAQVQAKNQAHVVGLLCLAEDEG